VREKNVFMGALITALPLYMNNTLLHTFWHSSKRCDDMRSDCVVGIVLEEVRKVVILAQPIGSTPDVGSSRRRSGGGGLIHTLERSKSLRLPPDKACRGYDK